MILRRPRPDTGEPGGFDFNNGEMLLYYLVLLADAVDLPGSADIDEVDQAWMQKTRDWTAEEVIALVREIRHRAADSYYWKTPWRRFRYFVNS